MIIASQAIANAHTSSVRRDHLCDHIPTQMSADLQLSPCLGAKCTGTDDGGWELRVS